MAENASQSIETPWASGGLERPPDPRPLMPSTYGAQCQPFPGHFQFGHLSNLGLDPPLGLRGCYRVPFVTNSCGAGNQSNSKIGVISIRDLDENSEGIFKHQWVK